MGAGGGGGDGDGGGGAGEWPWQNPCPTVPCAGWAVSQGAVETWTPLCVYNCVRGHTTWRKQPSSGGGGGAQGEGHGPTQVCVPLPPQLNPREGHQSRPHTVPQERCLQSRENCPTCRAFPELRAVKCT